ncbi:hypothetical protein EI546_03775 [Aequorivita sp. H23M31]|uniref:Uncharacterized protein n=1 Tax=Aequorivita ciconiae TaxID=2494375 RepID=A0A410G0Z8_9FLAO|nr:hypothetical protein [Aequorivita sp. H23M31]QAA80900.1 hypothetical protein EI546_03775 [Aequorivita sp. H23M31]
MDLEFIRSNYENAVKDKELCRGMMDALTAEKDEPVYLAYLSGLQTLWANHTINPIAKWDTFKKGTTNLDRAVTMAPNNLEIRFIRLSVQKNAPRFLGYYKEIETDEAVIEHYKDEIESLSLLRLINKI